MKIIFALLFLIFPLMVQALTIDEIINKNGKDVVISVLKSRLQHKPNKKLTVKIGDKLQEKANPNIKHITAETIQIDMRRLGLSLEKLNQMSKAVKRLQVRSQKMTAKYVLEKEKRNREKAEKKKKTIKKVQASNFVFDAWQAGISIDNMKVMAWERQLPLSPGTTILTRTYNSNIINSQPEQRYYSYLTNILEKPVLVTLFFTKQTRKLYKIEARFLLDQHKQEERKHFYETLHFQLSQKYGKATKTLNKPGDYLLSDNIPSVITGGYYIWKINEKNSLALSYQKNYQSMETFTLIYRNLPLENIDVDENVQDIQQRLKQPTTTEYSRL